VFPAPCSLWRRKVSSKSQVPVNKLPLRGTGGSTIKKKKTTTKDRRKSELDPSPKNRNSNESVGGSQGAQEQGAGHKQSATSTDPLGVSKTNVEALEVVCFSPGVGEKKRVPGRPGNPPRSRPNRMGAALSGKSKYSGRKGHPASRRKVTGKNSGHRTNS